MTALDILVNNAGVKAVQELTLTDGGHELQFATNHLGHLELALGPTAPSPRPATRASSR